VANEATFLLLPPSPNPQSSKNHACEKYRSVEKLRMGIHLIKIQTQVSNSEYHHVLVPHDLSKPKVLKTIIQSVCVYVWDVVAWNIIVRMGLRKVAVNCIVFVYAIWLLVPNCNFRLLNEYLSESWTLCSSLWRISTPSILRLSNSSRQVRINNYWNSSQIELKFMSLPVNIAVYQANPSYAMHTYF
jgi:hypothetical protein